MADKRIKGITIEIGGETTALQKSLAEVNKRSSSLTKELKDVERLLKFNPGNVEALAQKQKLLSDQVSVTTEKLNSLKNAEKQVQDQFQKGTISEEQYRSFRREIEFTEGSLAGLQKKLSNVVEEQNEVSNSTKQLENLLRVTDVSAEKLADTFGSDLLKSIEKGTASTKELEDALQRLSKEALGTEVDMDKLKRSLSSLDDGASVKKVKKELVELSKESKDAERAVDKLKGGLSEMGGALSEASGPAGEFVSTLVATPWGAIGAGLAVVGGAAIQASLEFEKADSRIQASLGVTKKQAKELGEVAESVWKKGFGENVDDVARSVITVSKNLKGIPKEQLKEAAEFAQILADTMEVDVTESTRSVNQLMETFGMSASQSFDLITKGFQEGLDFSGEFLDSINEYSPQFKALGMDATDMFTIFKQGSENGAFNLDKLGDIVKEFNIRVKDGSKSTAESFKGMSKETQNLWKQFNDGKVTGEVVFNAIVKELSGMDDKVKANQLAVGVFGTQWEDLESDVVGALDTSINKLGQFEGATKKAGKALNDNKTAAVKEKYREITASTEEAINKFLYFAFVTGEKQPEIADTFKLFGNNVSEGTKKAVSAFLDLSNQANTQVSLLKSSVIPLSQETADKVSGIFGSMATQIRDSINQRQQETLTNMQIFFSSSSALTASEEANALAKMTSNYETRTKIVTDGEKRANEILQTARKEKRSITDTEARELTAIRARMQTQAIDMMTKNEAEQKSILERLKVESGKITAQQAADVVKNSLKQKNDTIKAAEEQYDMTVQEIIRQRDETKSISKDQADKLIADAKRQRDKSVAEAQIMHRDVVREAKALAKGQASQVDWGTGQVKSKFENMKDKVLSSMKDTGGSVKKEWNKAQDFLESIDLKQIGKDIINGLINGIKAKGEELKSEARSMAKSIKKSFTDMLDIHSPSRVMREIGNNIGEGLILGIADKKGLVVNASDELAKAAIPDFIGPIKISEDRLKAFNILIKSVTSASAKEIALIHKNANAERAKVTNDANQKIADIEKKAATQKKGLTLSQKIQINNIEREAAEERAKISAKEKADVAKSQKEISAEKLKALQEYVSNQKNLNRMSLEQEVEFWKQALTTFKNGTTEKVQAQIALNKALDTLNAEAFAKEKKWIDEKKYYNQLSLAQELKVWEEVQSRYKKGTEERAEADREVYRLKKQIHDELIKINEEYTSKIQASQQRLIEGEQKLTEEYNKAVSDRTRALYSFAGIFDEINKSSEVSGQKLIENLQGQVSTFAKWADNIKSLAAKGIDEGLLAELREMGPKAYAEIAALNSLTDEELQQYAALWKEKNALARTQATDELAGLKTDTQIKIEELRKQTEIELTKYKDEWLAKINQIRTGTENELNIMNSSMKSIGNHAIQGLMDGLSQMTGPLLKEARDIANAVKKTIQQALDIHSPSRETMWMGEMLGEGLIQGMDQTMSRLQYMSSKMASAALPNINQGEQSSLMNNLQHQKSGGNQITQHLHFYGDKPLTPSETARKNRQALRQLAMEWGN